MNQNEWKTIIPNDIYKTGKAFLLFESEEPEEWLEVPLKRLFVIQNELDLHIALEHYFSESKIQDVNVQPMPTQKGNYRLDVTSVDCTGEASVQEVYLLKLLTAREWSATK